MQTDTPLDLLAEGRWNRITGWALVLLGLVAAALLDPWLFGLQQPSDFAGSLRSVVRHAQGVTLAMALLQLAMSYVLASKSFPRRVCQWAACLSASGALLYSAGYGLGVFWHAGLWAVPCGSALNLAAFLLLTCNGPSGRYARQLRWGLRVVCFGMLLDLFSGLATVQPDVFMPAYVGPEDGVRWRMLRLARVAAIALCVLTLLYQRLAEQEASRRRLADWGGTSLLFGAIGMPTILTAACLSWIQLKYLLPVPATATMIGVAVAVLLAWRQRRALDRLGWTIILISLTAGLFMGLYAFDGPLATPEFLGSYNEFARRLSRLAHSYCVVLGMLAIFVAREMPQAPDRTRVQRVGISMFVVGSIVTIAVMLLQMLAQFPTITLALGPAIVAVATLMCIGK